jgi:hypothetical protein
MATDRLKIYNGALLICQERELATLAEEREARRSLDLVWNDGGVRSCLEMGQWSFAMRSKRVDYSTDVDPQFGYARAFLKGTDWCVTSAVCHDEYYRTPLLQYKDEGGYWWADLDEIYVSYVSDASGFGGDFSKWSASFTEFVKAYFAWKIVGKLAGASDGRIKTVMQIYDDARKEARNRDAQGQPTRFMAEGRWVQSRTGNGMRPFSDGGSRSNLIG